MYALLIEAFTVGGGLTILGLLVSYLYLKFNKTKNNVCLDIFNNKSLIHVLFICGFTFHLLCEFSGINKWYCKNGNACH